MHGQGNYTSQVGQGPYPPPSSFHQRPANPSGPPPPPFRHGPPPPVVQHGHPSFHPTPGIHGYHQHGMPGAHDQGPRIPFPSNGMNSVQSHLPQPWNQNVRQLPPTAAPRPPPSAYPPHPSQWNTMERGPPHQPPYHAPPPPPPPYASDPFGSSEPSIEKHSYSHSVRQLPPPPPLPLPLPPPPPHSSPPGAPPLQPSAKPAEEKVIHEIEVLRPCNEKSGPEVRSVDAVVAYSPGDSDMDMEDDITQPEEEKQNLLSNLNDDCAPTPKKGYVETQPQAVQQTGEHAFPPFALDENVLIAQSSVSKDERGGSVLPSVFDIPLTGKVCSATDDLGAAEIEQTKQQLDVVVQESSSQCDKLGQSNVTVASGETGYKRHSSQLVEGADPFELLQGYATDNTSENEGDNLLGDVSSPSIKVGFLDFDSEKGCNIGSGSPSESNKHMPSKPMIGSPKNVIKADQQSFVTRKNEGVSDKGHIDQESVSTDTRVALQGKKNSRNNDANIVLEGANLHNEDMNSKSIKSNVDEFGRLVREGVSDSDKSDSPHRTRKHSRRTRKRSRSKSRSRSPHDRRRRRSPRRRHERRGRSRSSSPKTRRSRSRSPALRRGTEFIGDKPRQEKSQLPECFDFLRGKCYRGASCRYSHHEPDKSERVRHKKDKQHYRDITPTVRSPGFHEESEVLPSKEMKDKEPPCNPMTSPDKTNYPESASVTDVIASNLSGYSANGIPSGNENHSPQESPAKYSDKVTQIIDKPDLKQDSTGPVHSVGSPIINPHSTEQVLSQSSKELAPPIANHPSQLPLPLPLPPVSQVMSAPFARPITQDHSLMPHISPFHSTPGNYSSYQAPLSYQHSHFPGPSLGGSFLPPPPPRPHGQTVNVSNPSLHMQQSLLPIHSGSSSYTSMRPHSNQVPNQSQTGQYEAYPSPQELDRRPHGTDDFSSNHYVSNLSSQQSGPHIAADDRVSGTPEQRIETSQSFPHAKEINRSLGGSCPSDSFSSHNRPYVPQASYGMQYSATDSMSSQQAEPGMVSSSMTRITPDAVERNQPSYVHDFVGSRLSNRFNPYASTFDKPLSSIFRPNALVHENETPINTDYGVQFGLSSVPVDGHNSQSKISPFSSAWPPENVLPKPGGDQYDPLFDSIEPASTSFSKVDHKKQETTGVSDDILRLNGSDRALNMEDIRQGGGTALSDSNSIEIEEYGETADAEVGAVLNGSPSKSNDGSDMNAGEVEIDQVKSSEKKKKGKDSRSMKLFKVSVATFVKDVLKPSWREGNMSKEAFKTIVKKTVDKVSGAMKKHHVPKSQAKINHYINSSRGKLTKLVMGYVDKYVKV